MEGTQKRKAAWLPKEYGAIRRRLLACMVRRFGYFIRGLETIRQTSLTQYTDLPIQDRLYVEDIDSFQKLVRLFETPADLFIVQYVRPIADLLIRDVQGKTTELRSKGRGAHFLIIDGQDTARLLHAFGKI